MSKEHTDEENKTNETGSKGSATQDKGTSAANDQDVKNVVSQRDRANEENRSLREELAERDERLARLEASDIERDKRDTITSFLKDNKEKYPDVEPEDLLSANDPSELDDLADKHQKRFTAIEQRALAKLQVADEEPELTLEELQAKEKAILESDEPDKFEKIVSTRLNSK